MSTSQIRSELRRDARGRSVEMKLRIPVAHRDLGGEMGPVGMPAECFVRGQVDLRVVEPRGELLELLAERLLSRGFCRLWPTLRLLIIVAKATAPITLNPSFGPSACCQ